MATRDSCVSLFVFFCWEGVVTTVVISFLFLRAMWPTVCRYIVASSRCSLFAQNFSALLPDLHVYAKPSSQSSSQWGLVFVLFIIITAIFAFCLACHLLCLELTSFFFPLLLTWHCPPFLFLLLLLCFPPFSFLLSMHLARNCWARPTRRREMRQKTLPWLTPKGRRYVCEAGQLQSTILHALFFILLLFCFSLLLLPLAASRATCQMFLLAAQ